jgi:hypothetical protein
MCRIHVRKSEQCIDIEYVLVCNVEFRVFMSRTGLSFVEVVYDIGIYSWD